VDKDVAAPSRPMMHESRGKADLPAHHIRRLTRQEIVRSSRKRRFSMQYPRKEVACDYRVVGASVSLQPNEMHFLPRHGVSAGILSVARSSTWGEWSHRRGEPWGSCYGRCLV